MNKPLFARSDYFPGDIIQTSNAGRCSETSLFLKESEGYGFAFSHDNMVGFEETKLAKGYYHIDANGNIVGVCPTWNGDTARPNIREMFEAHDIDPV